MRERGEGVQSITEESGAVPEREALTQAPQFACARAGRRNCRWPDPPTRGRHQPSAGGGTRRDRDSVPRSRVPPPTSMWTRVRTRPSLRPPMDCRRAARPAMDRACTAPRECAGPAVGVASACRCPGGNGGVAPTMAFASAALPAVFAGAVRKPAPCSSNVRVWTIPLTFRQREARGPSIGARHHRRCKRRTGIGSLPRRRRAPRRLVGSDLAFLKGWVPILRAA